MMRRFIPQPLKPAARAILKIYQAARRAVFYPYYALGTSDAVWLRLMNREGRALYRRNAVPLEAIQQRMVSDLKAHGIAMTHLNDLFPGRELLAKLEPHARQALAAARVGRKKTFLRYAWLGSGNTIFLDLADPLIRLAIEPKVLEMVNAYMGMWSKLDFYSLAATIPVPDGSKEQGSQRWHRDPGDKRICKIFLYLTNVLDGGAGPFCYVRGSHQEGRWRQVYPPRPDDGYYPPAGEIERVIPAADIQSCLGPAGTIIFCDTTGFHRGGYSTTRERIMFTAAYSAKWSITHPIKYRYPERFNEALLPLLPIQRYAVDNR